MHECIDLTKINADLGSVGETGGRTTRSQLKLSSIIAVHSFTVGLILVGLSACRRNPELSETLTWMDNTYNPQGVSRSTGHGQVNWYSSSTSNSDAGSRLVEGWTQTFTYDGCQVTLHTTFTLGDIVTNSIDVFDLRDVNPQSIKTNLTSSDLEPSCVVVKTDSDPTTKVCERAYIAFDTHSKAAIIDEQNHTIYTNLKGSDHDSRSSRKETSGYFWVDDIEYADRFAKAFRHAVELCGGRPEPF
jgi:hypothetical protein